MDFSPNETCPECGAEVSAYETETTVGLQCIKCNWSVVTTNHNRPPFDETAYTVFASAPEIESKKLIALLASELALPIVEARTLVTTQAPIARDVNALEVYRLDKKLRPRGVALFTEPAFPWPLP